MTECVILDAGGVICLPRMGDWFTPVRFDEVIGEKRLAAVSAEKLASAKKAAAKIYLDESLLLTDESLEYAARRNYFLDLAKRCDWVLTDNETDVLARDMTENDARYDFYDDARQGLRALGEKYTLGLLSDSMPSIKRIFENAGLLEMFDAAVISCDIGATKPDIKMYQAICGKLDIDPRVCCFVDDKVKNLLGAEEMGIRGIHMCREGESDWHGLAVRDLFHLNRELAAE